MKRATTSVAFLVLLGLVLAACGDDATEPGATTGGTQGAAACTQEKLTEVGSATATTAVGGYELVGNKRVVAQAGSEVKIGFFGDLTGANSSLVVHSRDAAALAFKKANEAGNLKVRIRFTPQDNKDASPDTAPTIEQGFIQDNSVVGVVGGAFSGETRAVGKLFERAGLAHVSPSATGVDLTKQGWPFFRVLPNDDVQGPQAGELLTKVLGCKKIAVIDDKSEYGAGIAKAVAAAVTQNAGEVVETQGIEPTTDYTTLIDTLLSKNPDAVFYGGYDSEFSLIVKQARDKGLKSLLASGDGSKGDKLPAIGDTAEGVVVACPCLDPTVSADPEAKKFSEDFKAEYNKDPGIYGAEGWDAAQVFIAAIDASDDDGSVTRKEVLDAVKAVELQGVTKSIKFTETGEVEDETIFAYVVRGGKFQLVGAIRELGA